MSQTDDLVLWTHQQKCEKAVEALGQNGFTAVYCPDRQKAIDYILKEATSAETVGFGGSMSVADLGVQALLAAQRKEVLNHSTPGLTREEKLAVMRRALTCDLYLAGTNAVTVNGWLVNIDATGNRVAAMIFGPHKVIVVVGRNKLVEGDLTAAIRRVKDRSTPPNAKRLGFNTPCAKTGFCSDCNSPDRLCRATTVLDRRPRMTDFHVLVVNEDLGL
jgi:hypothetical protein